MDAIRDLDVVYIVESVHTDYQGNEQSVVGGAICIDKRGVLVTAAHVVPNLPNLPNCEVSVRSRNGGPDFVEATILDRNVAFDICFLQIKVKKETDETEEINQNYSCVEMVEDLHIREGDGVFSWVHISQITFSLFSGTISYPYENVKFPTDMNRTMTMDDGQSFGAAFRNTLSFRTAGGITRPIDKDFFDYHPQLPLIEIHGFFTAAGASGCPVFTSNGTMIGILLLSHSCRDYVLPTPVIVNYIRKNYNNIHNLIAQRKTIKTQIKTQGEGSSKGGQKRKGSESSHHKSHKKGKSSQSSQKRFVKSVSQQLLHGTAGDMSAKARNQQLPGSTPVPQNRLTWPELLDHPFVRETSEDVEAREIRATTAAARGYDASWKGEGDIQKAAFPISNNESCQVLDRLENNSRTVKGANSIGQDNEALSVILLRLKNICTGSPDCSRDQDIICFNQSLRILSNFVAASAINYSGVLDEIIYELLGAIASLANLKLADGNDLIAKSFLLTKKLIDNYSGSIGGSYVKHWVSLVGLFSKVVSTDDSSGRLLYESTACITAILSKTAQSLKTSALAATPEVVSGSSAVIETVKQILDHAKVSNVVDFLCLCLANSGSSMISGSSNLLRVACEACQSLWSLIDALELLYVKENSHLFPLYYMRSHSLLRLESKSHERGSLVGIESTKVIDAVTRSFLSSSAIQFAVYHCLRQHNESGMLAGTQLILRCCLHSNTISSILCGLPISLPVTKIVSGGGDGTIISEIFSILSLCASSYRDAQTADANNQKCKIASPGILVLHSCLVLATVAQCLKSSGRNSSVFMLTSSPKKQLPRLSVLAHHISLDERTQNFFQPRSSSSMLALASILSLETGVLSECSISEIAVPLIPRTATLCDNLKVVSADDTGIIPATQNGMLSYWHGFRDGCVGLLEARLKWGGALAVQQSCAGIPHLLITLLANNLSDVSVQETDCTKDQIALSPVGVVWTLSSICHCLSGGTLTFRQILLRSENVKFISDLISDVHLMLIKCWPGPGGGREGVRDTINAVIDLLAFPFVAIQRAPGLASATASVNSGFVLNMGSPGGRVCAEDKDMVKAIEASLKKYIEILLETGVPGYMLRCLEHMELKDIARLVAFLAKMTGYRPLVEQLIGKGLLDPARMRRLFDSSSPKEVTMDVLMIVSDLARMDKVFYEDLNGAEILQFLKDFLTHEDPNVRAETCSALGNMCRHSSYFYSLLAKHHIVHLLIDRCADPDKRTRKFACFAIGNAAYHNDLLYDELRRSIPQLANLLLSAEEDKTKSNAASALSNLVHNSNKLCEDIVSKGAMQALLKLVSDCSLAALNPNRRDAALNESPLKIAMFSLAKMCGHLPCRQFLRSSELYPVIGRLRQSPEPTISDYAAVILNKTSQT